MSLAAAVRMAAAAINIGSFFHRLALGTAVFAGLRLAGAGRMRAFFGIFGCHLFLLNETSSRDKDYGVALLRTKCRISEISASSNRK
jgi:hypothetical protein